jgi:outer membrane cobalamin receptor
MVVFSHMDSSNLLRVAVLVLVLAMVGVTAALADSPNKQFGNKYVFVTGSRIPQRVKVKSIGTATFSPVRVYTRREIDQTGRFTTEGVLAQDPDVRVISGHGGPIN